MKLMKSLLERYENQIAGTLSCFDRIIITGTIPGICYADGMTSYLNANKMSTLTTFGGTIFHRQ